MKINPLMVSLRTRPKRDPPKLWKAGWLVAIVLSVSSQDLLITLNAIPLAQQNAGEGSFGIGLLGVSGVPNSIGIPPCI